MRFAVAKDLITPDFKTHLSGYGSRYGEYFEAIHDDLYVKCLVIDDGASSAVLISFDLLMHDYSLSERVKTYVEERYGIPQGQVLLSYTHTHTGPGIEGYDPGQSSDAYEAFLLERTLSCVNRAFQTLIPGSVSIGFVQGDWNINRRQLVNGRMSNHPNRQGPRDDTIVVLKFADTDGKIRALALEYACHPVTIRDSYLISADYPGRLCQLLEARYFGSTAVFFQGAGGNSRPLITAGPDGFRTCTFEQLDEMATAMSQGVATAIERGSFRPIHPRIAGVQFSMPLPIDPYPEEFFRKIAKDPAVAEGTIKNGARWVLDRYGQLEDVVRLNAGILRLADDVYILLMCGEVCFEVKEKLANALFADKDVIFIGYGDGTGYIPDDKIIAQGGYEAEGSVVENCMKGPYKPGIDAVMHRCFAEHLTLLAKG